MADTRNRQVIESIYSLDKTPPRVFKVFGSASAAMLFTSVSAFMSSWFQQSGLGEGPPTVGLAAAVLLLVVNSGYTFYAARRQAIGAQLME
jgi:hypothetical protein